MKNLKKWALGGIATTATGFAALALAGDGWVDSIRIYVNSGNSQGYSQEATAWARFGAYTVATMGRVPPRVETTIVPGVGRAFTFEKDGSECTVSWKSLMDARWEPACD